MYLLKSVGADPEFFLTDGWGKPVPAIGKIGGTKQKPRFINKDGFSAVQEDNVMVEFNIRPSRTAREFMEQIRFVRDYAVAHALAQGLVASFVPSLVFSAKDLKDPQAMTIGCDPDYNAHTLRCNDCLEAHDLGRIRVSGGHVHVSFEKDGHLPELEEQAAVVKMLDLCLGVPSVILDPDVIRRKFYGKAGCFRPKEYGIEYRTLSNFWIADGPRIAWVFNQVTHAFRKLNEGVKFTDIQEADMVRCINTMDRGLAMDIMATHGLTA